jgi:hypothetical protein
MALSFLRRDLPVVVVIAAPAAGDHDHDGEITGTAAVR